MTRGYQLIALTICTANIQSQYLICFELDLIGLMGIFLFYGFCDSANMKIRMCSLNSK
jgi:hypothetical protein